MKFSQLFTKTTKQIPKDEVSKNSELLIRAGYVDKLMSGVYTYLPLGLRVLNKIKNIIRLEIDVLGGQEILMPALTPKENYEKTGRWDMDCLFKLKGVGDKEYALGATHEEIITPLIQKFASSYKDFPMAVYQIQDKFRNEPRAKSGILRGREFSMKDLYNFDIDEKRFDEFYTRAQQAYANIFTTVGLGDLTYLTYASGGAFSKYSHEYQTVVEVGEDTIHLCEACGWRSIKKLLRNKKPVQFVVMTN
jgi:prolyl-tRNA synthetase